MAFEIPFGVLPTVAQANVDERYGTYTSVAQANSSIPQAIRLQGLTVGIIEEGSVVEYWYKSGITDTDLVVKTAGTSGGGSAYVPLLFVTDIKAPAGFNVIAQRSAYPNDNVVTSYSSNSSVLDVTIEWDRGALGYVGEPEIKLPQHSAFYNIFDNAVVKKSVVRNGSTTTVVVELNGDGAIGFPIELKYAGVNDYIINGSSLAVPQVTSVTFPNGFPLLSSDFGYSTETQSHLKGGDNITVRVEADVPFTKIIVENFGLGTYREIPVTSTTFHQFTLTVASDTNSTTNTLQKLLRVRVVDTNGTVSDTKDSSLVNYDNTPASYTVSIQYVAPYTATKFGDNVSLSLNSLSAGAKSIVEHINPFAWFSILKNSESSYTLSLLIDSFLETLITNNIRTRVIKPSNGMIHTTESVVRVANKPIELVSPSNKVVSSGYVNSVTNVYDINTKPQFNQQVRIMRVGQGSPTDPVTTYSPETGVTVTASLAMQANVYATTFNIPVIATESANHNNTPRSYSLIVENLAGKVLGVSVGYIVKGFATKTFTLDHPNSSTIVSIPEIFDPTKIRVSATGFANLLSKLSTDPNYCQNFRFNTMAEAIASATASSGAKYNAWTVENKFFRFTNEGLQNLGYVSGNSITVNIEELS